MRRTVPARRDRVAGFSVSWDEMDRTMETKMERRGWVALEQFPLIPCEQVDSRTLSRRIGATADACREPPTHPTVGIEAGRDVWPWATVHQILRLFLFDLWSSS